MKELLKEFEQAQRLPHNLSDLHYKIAHHYGEVADEYEIKIPEMAAEKKRLMVNAKSMAAAEKEFEQSVMGIPEKEYPTEHNDPEKIPF